MSMILIRSCPIYNKRLLLPLWLIFQLHKMYHHCLAPLPLLAVQDERLMTLPLYLAQIKQQYRDVLDWPILMG